MSCRSARRVPLPPATPLVECEVCARRHGLYHPAIAMQDCVECQQTHDANHLPMKDTEDTR